MSDAGELEIVLQETVVLTAEIKLKEEAKYVEL